MTDSVSEIQSARAAMLVDFTRRVANTKDLQTLCAEMVVSLQPLLDFVRISLALVNEDQQTYHLQTLYDRQGQNTPIHQEKVQFDLGLPGAVIRSAEVKLSDRLETGRNGNLDPINAQLSGESTAAILGVPIKTTNQVAASVLHHS